MKQNKEIHIFLLAIFLFTLASIMIIGATQVFKIYLNKKNFTANAKIQKIKSSAPLPRDPLITPALKK